MRLLASLALVLWAFLPTATAETEPSAATIHGHGGGDRIEPGNRFSGRSSVIAPNGAAATAHPLATQTAIDILKAGGTAVDAAIAANAMLGLVEPTGNGIGGDLFAIVWDPRSERLYGLNGSGRSPASLTLDQVQAAADLHMDGEEIPPFSSVTVSVPGTVDGWFMMHDRFGKLDMAKLLAPSIAYAENGAPIPEVIAHYWSIGERRYNQAFEAGMLEEVANANATYFSPAPKAGSLFKNPDLANTYRKIAANGRSAFYEGEIATTIDAYMKRIGGQLSAEDLASHEGEWVTPLCVPYRDARVCQLPPNTQGVAALQMLQMLERFPMSEFGYGSADSLMAQIEAKRLAFVDRARGYADPAVSDIPPSAFTHPDYANQRSTEIDLTAANTSPSDTATRVGTDGNLEQSFADGSVRRIITRNTVEALQEADIKLKNGDTTYLTVADADGMIVSLIQSNYRGMGSGLVPDGLGFMLQNRGQLFSLDPKHPNAYAPSKRPFHTIIPGFAFRKDCSERILEYSSDDAGALNITVQSAQLDDTLRAIDESDPQATVSVAECPERPWLSFGLMGGGMQPQGHVQIILNLIDYGMDLQEAGDAARWRHDGGCEPTDALTGDACEADMGTVFLESGFDASIRDALRARGHQVEDGRGGFGGYQAIMRNFENNTWIAATEMRKDGSADGY